MPGPTVASKSGFDDRDHVHRPDRPTRVGGKTHAAVFVDEGEDPKMAPVFGLIGHEVPTSYLVDAGGALPLGGGETHALATPLPAADLETFPAADALHALGVDLLARPPQERGDAPVAIAGMLAAQGNDLPTQLLTFPGWLGCVVEGAACQVQRTTDLSGVTQ